MDRDKERVFEEKLDNIILKHRFITPLQADNTKWIAKAAQLLYKPVNQKQINAFEEAYPKMIQMLFESALQLMNGKWGEKRRDAIALHLDQEIPVLEIGRLLQLRLEDLFQPSELAVLQHLFHHNVEICLHPSSLTIQQLLRFNQVEMALTTAEGLANIREKDKSFELIIIYHLSQGDTEKAIAMWQQLTSMRERARAASRISDSFIQHDQRERAIAFAQSTNDPEIESELLSEIALHLMKKGERKQAENALLMIQEQDRRDYAKSNLVLILSNQNQFEEAQVLAQSIQDNGYRQDAILAITKAYLQIRRVDAAIQYIDSLTHSKDKEMPSQIIMASLKANHQDAKIVEISKLFPFLQNPLRRAA